MSAARRPLLTAAAAGALLCALWFVPSANASGDEPAIRQSPARSASVPGPRAPAQEVRLADSGGVDTTPYVVGGAGFLGLGATMVAVSLRRSRPL
ncbi:hypothetical protein [Streptomyces sp. NPDC057702]|uniref:hypothetical protein n=1 Tax=unclassified Streptomyces TaxID=2593676 RepID=UPI00367D661A